MPYESMSLDECLARHKGVVRARSHVFFGFHKACDEKVREYDNILSTVFNFTPEMIADFKIKAMEN